MLRMERVEVGIILRKGAGLYHPERLSGLGGGGARATQPGAGRPASPWVATTDPTLGATTATARDPDRCDRGGSPVRGPLPHAASARGCITPRSPRSPAAQDGAGLRSAPPNLLPRGARRRLVLPDRPGFAISIPLLGLGPPPTREPGETHGRGRILGGLRAPNPALEACVCLCIPEATATGSARPRTHRG